MFQDYSIDDYKKACYIILRPDLTPEYFIRHFGMSRYEYSICQQRLKELQKFYGIEYHFEENRIRWTVTDEKQFQQHYKGMWSFYNRHRRNLTNRSELVRGLYIARKILLASDHTDLDAVSETMGFSRSNLRNAIKLCRTFLQSYNIRLENAPHYGVYPSVNQAMYPYLQKPNTRLVSGVNMTFMMNVLCEEELSDERLEEILEESRSYLRRVNLETNETEDESFF